MSLLSRRRGVQSRPRFLPLTLPTTNLFAQFVAGVGETVTGGRVTNWADQSGHGWDATPVGANGPYSTTDYRGRRSVRFWSSDNIGMGFAAAHSFNAYNIAVFAAARIYYGRTDAIFGVLNYSGNTAHLRWNGAPGFLALAGVSTGIKTRHNPGVLGMVSTSAASAGYTQYEALTGLSPTIGDIDCAGAQIGSYPTNSTPSDMDLYEVAVYEGTPSSTDITNITAYLTNKYQIRATAYAKQIVFVGDSITAGYGVVQYQSYPLQVLRRGIEDWRMTNVGVGGYKIADITGVGTQTDSLFEAGYARNVVMVLIGVNDLIGGRTAAQMFTDLTAYVQTRVAAGWEVWVGTILAVSASQSVADSYNAMIRGTSGSGIIAAAGASRVVDFAARPEFDDTTDVNNTTYYQADRLHPTAAGDTILAQLVSDQLGGY